MVLKMIYKFIGKQAHILLLLLFSFPAFALATDYQAGHQALQIWNADAKANVPPLVGIWLNVMMVTFVSSLLFVWKHNTARILLAGVAISISCGPLIAKSMGLVVLSGYVALMHIIFWSPALFFLLKERAFLKKLTPYSVWAGLAASVITISFVFDVRDATIYLTHMLF